MATITEYTTDNKSAIAFLNDKCIAQTSSDIEKIKYNAIPSLSLFNNEVSTRVENDLCIGLSVDGISSVVELSVKNLVLSAEQWAISALDTSKRYSDVEIKSAKDELSNTLSSYTTAQITSLSTTADNDFAKYDDFSFEYDSNRHLIQLTLRNKKGEPRMWSIESTDFIKNRIIDHIDITDDGKYLRIFWKNSLGAEEHVDIELADLVKIYEGKDGIVISPSETGPYTIAADETIARTSDLTSVAATVNELSTKTVDRLDGRIDKLSSDVSAIQAYNTELSGTSEKTGIIPEIRNDIDSLKSKTDTTNTELETEKGKIDRLQAYVDALSSNDDDKPGIIKQLRNTDSVLSTEIDRLRNDVSGTVAIVGHIKLDKKTGIGPDEKDNKLSTIFQHYHFAEIGTLRNGNAYSIEITGLKDTYEDLSTSYFTTEDADPIKLADGDYIVLHSHTADPITLDNLTDNIVIVPSVKPYQLYSLSCNVYNLSVNLSTDISAVSTLLSNDISCKIGADGKYLSTLSILHIDDDDYYDLVKDDRVNPDILYIVSGDYNNAYDLQVKYVAEPTDDTDATTKKYVDDACKTIDDSCAAVSNTVKLIVNTLNHDLSTFADSTKSPKINDIVNALSSIYAIISAFS